MDTTRILSDLRVERERIDQAIAALESLNSAERTGRRGPGAAKRGRRGGRRRMSAAARKRLSQLLKQRWAQGKMRGRRKAAQ